MINHFDIATEGLRKDHRWIARLGFFFIEVFPKKDTGASAYVEPVDYIVRITVRYGKHSWVREFVMGLDGIATLEKVIAFFKGVRVPQISMVVKYIKAKVKEIIVKVKRGEDDTL